MANFAGGKLAGENGPSILHNVKKCLNNSACDNVDVESVNVDDNVNVDNNVNVNVNVNDYINNSVGKCMNNSIQKCIDDYVKTDIIRRVKGNKNCFSYMELQMVNIAFLKLIRALMCRS